MKKVVLEENIKPKDEIFYKVEVNSDNIEKSTILNKDKKNQNNCKKHILGMISETEAVPKIDCSDTLLHKEGNGDLELVNCDTLVENNTMSEVDRTNKELDDNEIETKEHESHFSNNTVEVDNNQELKANVTETPEHETPLINKLNFADEQVEIISKEINNDINNDMDIIKKKDESEISVENGKDLSKEPINGFRVYSTKCSLPMEVKYTSAPNEPLIEELSSCVTNGYDVYDKTDNQSLEQPNNEKPSTPTNDDDDHISPILVKDNLTRDINYSLKNCNNNKINQAIENEEISDDLLAENSIDETKCQTDTAEIKSGHKRAIDDNEGITRQALKKVRIFDNNSSKQNDSQDLKLQNTDPKIPILYPVEVHEKSKCLEDEKCKDNEELISKMNLAASHHYSSIDNEHIDRIAAKELEKLRTKSSCENQKLQRISRKDLENIVVQLFADKLLYEHELGRQRDLCKRLEATLEGNRKKAAQFHKEIDDLQKVTQRLQAEYSARKGQIVTPVKVKRSVGIHVTPNIISKGVTTSESVLNNVKYISPSKTKKAEKLQKIEARNKMTVNNSTLVPASQAAPVTQTVIPASVVNTINSVAVPSVAQVMVPTNVPITSGITKSRFIDLTDDEEVSKSLLKPALAGGTSMVAIPRQAINLANSGKFVALPQSSVNSLLLVPQNAATLVVPSMANSLQNVAGVHSIRAPVINSPIGINMSQNVSVVNSSTRLILTPSIGGNQAIAPRPQMLRHPAPLPKAPPQQTAGFSKKLPPQPILNLSHKDNTGIVLLWKMTKTDEHEAITSYQLYAYQEGSAPPFASLWKKVGSVKALELPMACTLTQFMAGHTYHFAVRAVDVRNRLGPFSEPKSIRLKK